MHAEEPTRAETAFRMTVEQYADTVTRLCCLNLKDPGQAEDLWQETFPALWDTPSMPERLLERTRQENYRRKHICKRASVMAAAVLLLALLSGTALVLADGGFFSSFFSKKAESLPDAQAYMDVSRHCASLPRRWTPSCAATAGRRPP